ncbi:MAG: hypothetical protein GY898_07415 [Proteobacteria bacterium]|nr:hypothetical protein [Pseudomonadota bacterium]
MMRRLLLLLAAALPLLLAGCKNCEPASSPSVQLGTGQGDRFDVYTDGQEVGLQPAPQGGFGVPVLIGTTGLQTELSNTADATLDVYIGGSPEGTFFSEGLQLVCESDSEGGRIHGQVVGLDKDKYVTNDDLLALDGTEVELQVTVVDVEGNEGAGTQVVTIVYGG